MITIVLGACAGPRREARLREELDRYAFQRPIDEVWPAALRLVNDRGFPLIGHDRVSAGVPRYSAVTVFGAKGFETRANGERRVAETGSNRSLLRYRIDAIDVEGRACHLEYIAVQGNEVNALETTHRDMNLELDLVRLLDSPAATAIIRRVEMPQ